jgi:exodeoxyribonuclease VII large subunit
VSRLQSSPEAPLPLRRVSQAIAEWIGRLGEVWLEGQVAQIVRRPGVQTYFLTLRDTDANLSMQVTCHRSVLDDPLPEGARIVLRARPDFYAERGTLSLRASEIRQVGIGELLARLERLRQILAAEGLFEPGRKRALPFLPHTIGLITGRASAAERDVIENARRRLPAAHFAVENTPTQGATAVSEIIGALQRLDRNREVEVIVIARGGGSIEDLLPFSNEALLRAVAACTTPVVSAIGHETDRPLLDLVADVAASTPTDAAKRVVPDLGAETAQIIEARRRLRAAVRRRADIEADLISGLPQRLRRAVRTAVSTGEAAVARARSANRSRLASRLELADSETEQLRARVISLSPQAVLDRGYAVVWNDAGGLIRAAAEVDRDQHLRVRVGRGDFEVTVIDPSVPTPDQSRQERAAS